MAVATARRPGWLTFAAVVLFSVAALRVISGIAYLADSTKVAQLSGGLFGDSLFWWGLWDLGIAAAALYAGYSLLDCQFMTEHLASLGAVPVTRETYLGELARAVSAGPAPTLAEAYVSLLGSAGAGVAVGDGVAPGTGVGVCGVNRTAKLISGSELGNASLPTPTSDRLWDVWPAIRRDLLARGRSTLRAEGLFGGDGLESMWKALYGTTRTAAEMRSSRAAGVSRANPLPAR